MVKKATTKTASTKERAPWGSLSKSELPIEIQADIPIPSPGRKGGVKYPFGKMEIGDSFQLPKNRIGAAQSSSYKYAKEHPEFKFITRKDGKSGRIWRIEVDPPAPGSKKKKR